MALKKPLVSLESASLWISRAFSIHHKFFSSLTLLWTSAFALEWACLLALQLMSFCQEQKAFPFLTSRDVNLEINVTQKFSDLYGANFAPLVTRMQADFELWSVLNLSLATRINSIKMNILPRFSYLFQCILLFLSNSFFRKVENLISEFVWNKKAPRLHKPYLQRPKLLGRMALPKFRFYYWASNIRILKYWLQYEAFNPPFG